MNTIIKIGLSTAVALLLSAVGTFHASASNTASTGNAALSSDIAATEGVALAKPDSLMRAVNASNANRDWETTISLCKEALALPEETLRAYSQPYGFFESYALAMLSLRRYQGVSEICRRGQPYIANVFTPRQKEYYALMYQEIIALILTDDLTEAFAKAELVRDINNREGGGVLTGELDRLDSMFGEFASKFDWKRDAPRRIKRVQDICNSLLLTSAADEDGSRRLRGFINAIIRELELLCFDTDNADDERYWNALLAHIIVCFDILCDDMPGREGVAYDLTLLRKNFLDYHGSRLHKKPVRQQDVRAALADDEMAVEIKTSPDEILIIRGDMSQPTAIAIPENIADYAAAYNTTDLLAVNETYTRDGAMSELIKLILPHTSGIKTIYISASNFYTPFNYGTLTCGGRRFDDIFNIVQMTTTADIAHIKDFKPMTKITAGLWGGIDYGKGVTLPHSLAEVNAIATILGDRHSYLYTGAEATEASFRETINKDINVIHIATHGYTLSPSSEPASEPASKSKPESKPDSLSHLATITSRVGLLMAGAHTSTVNNHPDSDDGRLTASEIARTDLSHIDIAVLSSCAGGLGDTSNLTGVICSVANSLISAGAKTVLMTLWDISDEATSVGMQGFYKALSEGNNPDEALHAMRDFMISHGYTDPYYWASFVLFY